MSGLRVGFVGCGLIAASHAANLSRDPRAQITAVNDLDRDRAVAFADRFASGRADVVRPDAASVIEAVDALYVCTWTSAHPDLVIAAAEAGKAVFCEKPLATGLTGAIEMTEAVERAGVTNQVGLVLRRSPAFRHLKQLVADDAGPVMNVVFRDDQYLPTQGLYGSTWRADRAKAGGGTLLEHSIHDLDLIDWLIGPIVEVSARVGSVHGIDGIDDQATVVLVAESGAQAALVSVWHDVLSRPSQRSVEVFTQGGWFALEGDWNGPVRWDRTDRFPEPTDGGRSRRLLRRSKGRTEDPKRHQAGQLSGAGLARAAEAGDGLGDDPDRAFVTAVLDDTPAHPSFSVAMRAHRLADAAYRSAAAGGAVIAVD